MSAASTTPLKSLRVSRYTIPQHNLIPNTSIQNYPLLIYHSVFPPSATASSIESHLRAVGIVEPQWRYTMYSQTHFHSTTHELLCISNGRARLCFGGEHNPDRKEIEVQKGDAIIMPAGVGHRLLEDLEGGFEMVGSYPVGKNWDMCYGKAGEEKKIQGISRLGWFKKDLIYGEQGPVLDVQ